MKTQEQQKQLTATDSELLDWLEGSLQSGTLDLNISAVRPMVFWLNFRFRGQRYPEWRIKESSLRAAITQAMREAATEHEKDKA